MQAPLRKTALSVALLSVGLAMSAYAQNPGSQGTTSATPGSTSRPAATAGGSTSAATSSASGATSATATPSRGASDGKLARGDRKFIEDAARGGMAEVQLGQLAAQKGQSSEVKQFGQKMADDHGKANDQLKSIASSKNVTLPTDLDRAHKRDYDRLSKLSGAEFDREYMKHMVSDHKKDVGDFRKEARSGKDGDVKGFASSTLPTLEQHLKLAQSADAAVRTANRGGNTARTSATGASTGTTPSGTSGGTSSGTTSAGTAGATSGGTTSGGTTSGGTTSGGTTSGGTTGTTSGSTTSGTSGGTSGSTTGGTSSSTSGGMAPSGSATTGGTSGTKGK
jgi:putative membrane protein